MPTQAGGRVGAQPLGREVAREGVAEPVERCARPGRAASSPRAPSSGRGRGGGRRRERERAAEEGNEPRVRASPAAGTASRSHASSTCRRRRTRRRSGGRLRAFRARAERGYTLDCVSDGPEIFDDLYLGLQAGGALRKQRRGEELTNEEAEALGRWQQMSMWRKGARRRRIRDRHVRARLHARRPRLRPLAPREGIANEVLARARYYSSPAPREGTDPRPRRARDSRPRASTSTRRAARTRERRTQGRPARRSRRRGRRRVRERVPAVEPVDAAERDPDAAEDEQGREHEPPPTSPRARETIVCTRSSEPSPSITPVAAKAATSAASNQIGAPPMTPTCRKSVTMYGAFGRKRSHASPSMSCHAREVPRRLASYSASASTNGSQARNRFQTRKRYPFEPVSATRTSSRAPHRPEARTNAKNVATRRSLSLTTPRS